MIDLAQLGSHSHAQAVAKRAWEHVPAFRKHLSPKDALPKEWDEIPLSDKKNYLLTNPYADLLADNYQDTFAVFSSSGSSGNAFYWPQLKDNQLAHGERLKEFLEAAFQIQKRPTMAIIGLALGSWIGGEHFSWALKNVAASTEYPFSVFSPGNQHDEIIRMIHSVSAFTEQILLFVCPSAIGHLRLRAEQQGTPLPISKMRFVVLGEPFPESMRLSLQHEAATTTGESSMLSIFGSADTGVIGAESPASASIRGLCEQNEALSAALGFSGVIPHLFHHIDPGSYLESVRGELCVTKWQGVPLIRYNLHDSVRLISWSELLTQIAKILGSTHPIVGALQTRSQNLPDILAITGRSDSCLLLCGTNLTEAMLDTALRSLEFAADLTGNYRARTTLDRGRQRLEITLECRSKTENFSTLSEKLYPLVREALGRVQPEFKDDWEKIYQRWDQDPANRIIDLKLIPWPCLSESNRVKQRGIQG